MEHSEQIELVRQAFEAVLEQLVNLKAAILEDGHNDWPLFAPGISDPFEARAAIIESISRVRANDGEVKSGLLCVSDDTDQAIQSLNASKDHFKATIAAVAGTKSARLLRNKLQKSHFRNENLRQILTAMQEKSLDLRACYAHIRRLPTPLISLSYTWAMNHKRIKKITVNQALEMAQQITDDQAQLAAYIALRGLPPDTPLMQLFDITPPQLKANIQFTEPGNKTLQKKTITVSGVLTLNQETLPKFLWRDVPSHSERMPRPTQHETECFVPPLGLYRYV